ncbi:DUF3631 domain-containing protein [Streptomyces sp. NPDC050161]|uniref:DUF3631 domain-containing protein n=1 Tax=Streptomyces sp. NPDC050161 TaxID=3365604 RepID=UPI0037A832A3
MYPSLLDALSATLLDGEPQTENPRHRALLDTYTDVQALDRQLAEWTERAPSDDDADELDQIVDLLVERMAAGAVLRRLLSAGCCCADTRDGACREDPDASSCPGNEADPQSIVQAALYVFGCVGSPEALPSVDLVSCLREIPGKPEGRWNYAELTPVRLARLMSPHGIAPRNVTYRDGGRFKSYRMADLLAAEAGRQNTQGS